MELVPVPALVQEQMLEREPVLKPEREPVPVPVPVPVLWVVGAVPPQISPRSSG
eukprot:COSAG06_NODE_48092_length_334_cov_1.323404_1_plen_54_part_00